MPTKALAIAHPSPPPWTRRGPGGGRDRFKREGGGRHGPTAETYSLGEYKARLHADFASFAAHRFRELNPRTPFALSWHHEFMAAKLAAVRDGCIRWVIINVPPRHPKSHLASAAFRAWCLGHESGLQVLCVTPGFTLRTCRGVACPPARLVYPGDRRV